MDSRGYLTEISKILSSRTYYSSAIIRAAISKQDGAKLVGGYSLLSEKEVTADREADYGKAVFVELSLRKKEFEEWLTRMINEQVASFKGLEVPTKGDFDAPSQVPENFVPSDYGFYPTEWGCNFFRYRMAAETGSLPGTLPVRSELPIYPDSQLALCDWLKVQLGFDVQNQFLFFLHNMESKIGQISLSPKTVGISITQGRGSFSNLKGKAYVQESFSGSYRPPLNKDLTFPDGKTEIALSFKPAFLYLTLLSVTGEIIDYRKFWPSYSSKPGLKFEVSPEEVERIVLQGENETVEFKRSLQNHHDIAETMVSFSNGKGGLIIVGVDDLCNIIGAADISDSTQTKIEERVRNFADELCDPPCQFTVTLLKVQGKDVLVLEVKEGPAKPFWLRNRGPMIRSGSNDRLMTRYETEQVFHKIAGPFP